MIIYYCEFLGIILNKRLGNVVYLLIEFMSSLLFSIRKKEIQCGVVTNFRSV